MAPGLSCADAAVMLGGGPESRLVTLLDRLTGGSLLAASAGGADFAGLSEKLRGASDVLKAPTGRSS